MGTQEARYALEPLVNLARLRIRDGDGPGAYHLLDSLNRAVRAKTEAVTDGRATSFQHLTKSAADHQQVCQWLWAVLLGDGARALVAAGQWDRARAHSEQHRGVVNASSTGGRWKCSSAIPAGSHSKHWGS